MKRILNPARLLGVCAVVAMLALAIAVWRRPSYSGLPTAVFLAPAQASFGLVQDQPTVSAECELVNNTSHAVRVTNTTFSCGCSAHGVRTS